MVEGAARVASEALEGWRRTRAREALDITADAVDLCVHARGDGSFAGSPGSGERSFGPRAGDPDAPVPRSAVRELADQLRSVVREHDAAAGGAGCGCGPCDDGEGGGLSFA